MNMKKTFIDRAFQSLSVSVLNCTLKLQEFCFLLLCFDADFCVLPDFLLCVRLKHT